MGGRAVLPGVVLGLSVPHHCPLSSPWWEALQRQRWSPAGPWAICLADGLLYLRPLGSLLGLLEPSR